MASINRSFFEQRKKMMKEEKKRRREKKEKKTHSGKKSSGSFAGLKVQGHHCIFSVLHSAIAFLAVVFFN